MKEINGRCLCGAVQFSVPDVFEYAGYCHCSECRRFSGSAFSAFGGIPVKYLRLLKGQSEIVRYPKSENSVLVFCRVCGSSLYAEKPKKGMVHLRLGSLSEAPSLAPQFHSFVGSKVPWYQIQDGLPQYEAGRVTTAT